MFVVPRKDLILANLAVPLENSYYFDLKPLRYRWIGEYDFQVFYKGFWQNADSIDWEFQETIKGFISDSSTTKPI